MAQYSKIPESVWNSLSAWWRGFRIVGDSSIEVRNIGSSYSLHWRGSDARQRQYGGSGGGVSAYYKLKPSGGSAGSGTTACTFTYELWPLDETAFTDTTRRIAVNLQPQAIHRDETGLYSQAAQGSIGEAVQVNGTWVLLTAFGERRLTQGCA